MEGCLQMILLCVRVFRSPEAGKWIGPFENISVKRELNLKTKHASQP